MKQIEFDPFSKSSLRIQFDCPNCGTFVESEEILVPPLNYSAETAEESLDYNDGFAMCGVCDREFNIDVTSGYGGGYIDIVDLPQDYNVNVIEKEYEELEAILSNTEFFENFQSEISKIQDLNDAPVENEKVFTNKQYFDEVMFLGGIILDDELVVTLRKLLFINVITCLESYLSSAFINTVISKPEYLKKFFISFENFKKEKFTMSQLIELKDKTEDIAKQAMFGITYHNFKVIKPMFKDTLGIIFPDFEFIAKAIAIRHDIVHRNGLTKENKPIIVSQGDIDLLIEKVETFVIDIDLQIKKFVK